MLFCKKKQQDFLADGLEDFDSDCDDLQLNTTSIFKEDHIDAFDSDCDEEHAAISNNDSYDELTSNNNVISYAEYMVTIETDAAQSVPSPEQNNDNVIILSISENGKLRAHLQAKFSEPKLNQNGSSVNTKFEKPPTSRHTTQFIPKVVEKNDLSKTITSHLHTNNIIKKCTKVLTSELLEQARALKTLDENLVYACKFAERIRDLLVYVSASCPFTQSGNEKWVPVTIRRKNNKPYVDTSKINQTAVNDTHKLAEKQDTQKTENNLLPFIGRLCYSNASGSKPKRNIKNDRIQRPSSRSQKNKVEAQLRKFKSSSNKNNHVSKCNANVKNVAMSKNSENVCLSCNECLFSVNHDACVVKYLNDVQKRKKGKSVKQKEKILWKPTGRVFTTIGHRWVPTGRILSMEGTTSLLTKITPATIVPIVTRFQTICIPAVAPNAETRMRYSIANNSLIRAHINTYGHPFNKTNFALARNFEVPSRKFGFLTIVEIVLWYLESSCSKNKTGQRDKLINFVSKFNGIVRFGNDHFAAIMVYGDLQIGNIMISRVYYVEGLGHNLFFVGQFCDSYLEVAFRKHTCFVRNLVGVDLLSRSRGSNLYIISMEEMMKSSSICLLSKASKSKSWPMRIESINRKKYILVIINAYSRFTWVKFLRTKDETLEVLIKILKQAQVRKGLEASVGHQDEKIPEEGPCHVFGTHGGKISHVKSIQNILIEKNHTEVFLEDLSGLPSTRIVEFWIDLVPGAINLWSRYHQIRVKEEDTTRQRSGHEGMIRFEKQGKLNPQYTRPFKNCLIVKTLIILLEELLISDKLQFIEEPLEIMDLEVKRLNHSRITIVKVRWNSQRGLEFTWERGDEIKRNYPYLFLRAQSLAKTN
ncbi:hypothetical protein Tco_0684790 [Tanacetum coccineum]